MTKLLTSILAPTICYAHNSKVILLAGYQEPGATAVVV